MRRSQVLGGATALVLLAGAFVATLSPLGRDASRDAARTATGSDAAAGGAGMGAVGAPVAGAADRATGGPSALAAVPSASSRVVKTAELTVSLAKASAVATAAQRANSVAERLGGFTASTETRTGDHASSALTLRVPVASYDAALTELRTLGKVTDETLGGRDVTTTLVDLDARLRSLRAQEAALNTLMAKANTVGETLQVAQAVGEVRTQIEQLAAQQKSLSDEADFATIHLALVGPAGVVAEDKPDPVLVDAAKRAVGGALDVFGGAIVVLGYVVPASVLAGLGYGVLRLRRRRVPAVA